MTALDALTVILGAVVTIYGTAIATNPAMPASRKRLIAAILAVALGVMSALITGAIEGVPADVTAWVTRATLAVAGVIIASQGFYGAFKGHLQDVAASTSSTPKRAIEE